MSVIHIYSVDVLSVPFGLCANTGAPSFITDLKAYSRNRKVIWLNRISFKPSRKVFKFANTTYLSFGSTQLLLYTSMRIQTIMAKLQVVTTDVPPLYRLEILDIHQIIVATAFNLFAKETGLARDDTSFVYNNKTSVYLYRDRSKTCLCQNGRSKIRRHILY